MRTALGNDIYTFHILIEYHSMIFTTLHTSTPPRYLENSKEGVGALGEHAVLCECVLQLVLLKDRLFLQDLDRKNV